MIGVHAQRFVANNKQAPLFFLLFCLLAIILAVMTVGRLQHNHSYNNFKITVKQDSEAIREAIQQAMSERQQAKLRITQVQEAIDANAEIIEAQRELSVSYSEMLNELQVKIRQYEAAAEEVGYFMQQRDKFVLPQLDEIPPAKPKVVEPPRRSTPSIGKEVPEKMQAVKDEFLHAWNSYKQYAWGRDELKPNSKTAGDWLGLGMTIVDSLDTLWLMNLKDEFKLARDWVADSLSFERNLSISFFETTIRELGGLLSAFEFSKDDMFLRKAEELATRLLKAFKRKIPRGSVNLLTGTADPVGWTGGSSILSEIGTIQLEFLYLAYHTGNPSYALQPLEVFSILDSAPKKVKGLYPLYVSEDGGLVGEDYSLGALGDSFYEYELKLWLLTNKQAEGYRRMYEESTQGILNNLVKKSNSGYTYVTQMHSYRVDSHMEHLTCFSGGMFALGAVTNAVEDTNHNLETGANITATCRQSYKATNTGIGPESFNMNGNEFSVNAAYYILRPETVESLFVLWRTTHDPIYREWAWEIFNAIKTGCRLPGGYAGLRNVNDKNSHDDLQQSFFLAETLKYLYLIFCDDNVVHLDDYVFNTEAHPLGKIYADVSTWPPALQNALLMK